MDVFEAAIRQVAPVWNTQGPNGGFIASELKKIHDGSLSVFPESVYSDEGRRQRRWVTTMREDYIPIHAMYGGKSRRMPVADECGVDGTLRPHSNGLFQQWKVPSRVTQSHCSSARESRTSVDRLADGVEDMRLGSHTRTASALPNISSAFPRPGGVRNSCQVETSKRFPPQRLPKTLATKLLMENYHTTDERNTVQRWLKQANDVERQAFMKALKVDKVKVTNPEDVTKPVKQWLKESTPKEHDVALKFFESLVGNKFIEGSSKEKKERIDRVIGILRDKHSQDGDRRSETSRRRHHYRNALTAGSRADRWRHQTWHHLPLYSNENKVANKSSILVVPNAIAHHHFTIHPDWGP